MAPLKRILLVEDNERDVELTLAALDENNLANEVVVARDGVEALDYLYQRGKFSGHANGLPVVVLLDLKMPKVDGLEVLRQMRSDDPTFKHVPVVMITSSREEQDLVNSYQLGRQCLCRQAGGFPEICRIRETDRLFLGRHQRTAARRGETLQLKLATEFLQHPVRILHLEDNEHDQILVQEMLLAEGLACELVAVKTREDFDSTLRPARYDLIISDFTLPSFDGLRALSLAREVCRGNPFHFFLRHHRRGGGRGKPQKRRGGLCAQTTAQPAGPLPCAGRCATLRNARGANTRKARCSRAKSVCASSLAPPTMWSGNGTSSRQSLVQRKLPDRFRPSSGRHRRRAGTLAESDSSRR